MIVEFGAAIACSPANAGAQSGVRNRSCVRWLVRALKEESWTPAFAGEQGNEVRRALTLSRRPSEQIGDAAIVADVARAAPQFGMLAIGELAPLLDRQGIVGRLERAERRDVTALEDVEAVISQRSIPGAGTIRPKDHLYQTDPGGVLMQIAGRRGTGNNFAAARQPPYPVFGGPIPFHRGDSRYRDAA